MRHSAVEGRTPADAAVVLKEESSKLTIRKQHHDSAVQNESVSFGLCFVSVWLYFSLLMVLNCSSLLTMMFRMCKICVFLILITGHKNADHVFAVIRGRTEDGYCCLQIHDCTLKQLYSRSQFLTLKNFREI
jgi:hypothetical protein